MTLTWSAELATGVAQFDEDHRQLIGIYNELEAACLQNKDMQVVSVILEKLLTASCDHFRREEEMMLEARYPKLAEHEAEHDRLACELSELRHRLLGGRLPSIDRAFLETVERWIVVHTVEMDRDYASYLIARGT